MSIHRVSIFLLNANRDLQVSVADMLTSRNWWLRKFLARNMALLLYELDFSKVMGKQFRSAINFFSPPRAFRDELATNLKALRRLHATLRLEFERIRNNTIAHRDADAMRQYRMIRALDEMTIARRCGEFFETAEPLIKQLIVLTTTSSELHHLLNQVIGRKAFRRDISTRKSPHER